MKKAILFLITIFCQSAHAEIMQGFFKFTCAPEIQFFEVSPFWVSSPDQIWKKAEYGSELVPEYAKKFEEYKVKPIGVAFDYKCESFKGNTIEVKHDGKTPFFDLYVNGDKCLEQISMRDDYPITYGMDGNINSDYIEFLSFSMQGQLWSFKSFLHKDHEFQKNSGVLFNIWEGKCGSKSGKLINYKYIYQNFVLKSAKNP